MNPIGKRFDARGAVLFPALIAIVAIPLLAAFAPLFSGTGALANLARALGNPRFTRSFGYGLGQALASACLALAVGLPGAWLLARRRFPGKTVLSALSAVPFCVPPLIVAIGFALWYGNAGYLNRAFMAISGSDQGPVRFLYSKAGVIAAHGFYNFPVVMRMVADALSSAPKDQEDAARTLGASRARAFRTVTLPSILPALGAAFSLVFIMCFFSFVIVLLFGPPGAGTPEVELYRAARVELDKSLAGAYALVETAVAVLMLSAYAWLENRSGRQRTASAQARAATPFRGAAERALAIIYALFIVITFLGPLASVLAESFMVSSRARGAAVFGLGNYLRLFTSQSFWTSLWNTLWLGLISAALASCMGFGLSLALKRHGGSIWARVLPMLPLAVSGVALAWGWSSLLGGSSPLAIAMVQAVSAYPFVLRSIQASVGASDERYALAAQSLGSSRWQAALRVRLPLALPALASGFAFSFAISAGDANALIVSPVPGFETLALRLYRLAGSYRFNEACAAAVVLALLSSLVFLRKDVRDGRA